MFLTAKFSRLDLGSIARMMGLPDFLANSALPQVIVKAVSGNRLFVSKANAILAEKEVGITISNITMPDALTVKVEVDKIDHAAVLAQVYGMVPDAVKSGPQYSAIFSVLDQGDCSRRLVDGVCASMSTDELDSVVAGMLVAFRPNLINAINKTCQDRSIDAVVTDLLVQSETEPQPKQSPSQDPVDASAQPPDIIYL
jgi:hypothetical protein